MEVISYFYKFKQVLHKLLQMLIHVAIYIIKLSCLQCSTAVLRIGKQRTSDNANIQFIQNKTKEI